MFVSRWVLTEKREEKKDKTQKKYNQSITEKKRINSEKTTRQNMTCSVSNVTRYLLTKEE